MASGGHIYHDPITNHSSGCAHVGMIQSRGLFLGSKPLEFAIPILLLQISVSSLLILFLSRLFKPLSQYSLVPQILGGIVLGPSVMGRLGKLTESLFPSRSLTVVDTLSVLGCTFYFFLIGVKLDLWMLKKMRKRELVIAFATFGLSTLFAIPFAILMKAKANLNESTTGSLLTVAATSTLLSFPVIAHYLEEIQMLNSEFGQVALSTSVSCYFIALSAMTLVTLVSHRPEKQLTMPMTLFSGVAIFLVSLLVVRPTILWLLKKMPEGEALKENFIYVVLLGVLVAGFVSQATGMDIFFGPLLYGLAIPSGPPLGSAVVDKVELINTWLLMPLFFSKVGLLMDLESVTFKEYSILQFTILTGWTGKFIGAVVSSLYWGIPFKDAVSLGLAVNVQGVLELSLFKIFLENKGIDEKSFAVLCTSMMVLSAIITPIIRHLHDPSRRYAVYSNQTIMHSRVDSELRVLVCAHDQEDVAATLKFLEAINPTKISPIAIYALHLIEHVGSAQPLLIPHKLTKTPSSKASSSKTIVNAFRYFEDMYQDVAAVYPFTAISTYTNMHDEICRMALNKKVSLIIIPYHKRFTATGVLEAFKKGTRRMNFNILDMAPCSVAVIVDRGITGNSRTTLGSWHSYSVAVLFLSGADDREALAIGTRMARQPNIKLTVIRLIAHPSVANLDDPAEKKIDNKALYEFRHEIDENERIMHVEEVVQDSTGTAAILRSMEDTQELIIVGRRHNNNSPLVLGLVVWEEETELGAIGDALASRDFRGNANILVVQQHSYIVRSDWDEDDAIRSDFHILEDEADHVPIHRSHV